MLQPSRGSLCIFSWRFLIREGEVQSVGNSGGGSRCWSWRREGGWRVRSARDAEGRKSGGYKDVTLSLYMCVCVCVCMCVCMYMYMYIYISLYISLFIYRGMRALAMCVFRVKVPYSRKG